MGIPVHDPNDPPGYDYACNSATNNCCVCGKSKNAPSNNADKTAAYAPTVTLTDNIKVNGNGNSSSSSKTETLPATFVQYHKITKDLVGNSKEFRIENNKCDLRIIGNSNRIRIGCNHGNLQIIGNGTRLKIGNNSGHIRYTGNDGRICLGSDSAQQAVDYIGNNGILKVVNATDDAKRTKEKTDKTGDARKQPPVAEAKSATNAKATPEMHSTPKKLKVKSASYGGAQWRQFNELFQRTDWSRFVNTSLPNLKKSEYNVECDNAGDIDAGNNAPDANGKSKKSEKTSKNTSKSCAVNTNSINIVNNYGNICIKNAVNVSI